MVLQVGAVATYQGTAYMIAGVGIGIGGDRKVTVSFLCLVCAFKGFAPGAGAHISASTSVV